MSSISRRQLATAIMGAVAVPAAAHAADSKQDSALKAKSVAQKVRASLIEELESQFQGFLESAAIGDLYLMGEVLLHHDGNSLGIHAAAPELALPAAFAEQIEAGVPCFVSVPEHLREAVERHVKVLVAADAAGRGLTPDQAEAAGREWHRQVTEG